MKTLHTYLLRQAISTLVMTVCVFAFILLLGNILKEILALLVNRQATVWLIIKAILLLLPWIMAYVLPFALLTAMLLLFGRLSADNELTAVKASGISLLSLITPLLIFSLAISALCAWFNLKITPESRVAYKSVLLQPFLKGGGEGLITEDRFIDEIPNVVLYVRKKNGNLLEDVVLYEKEAGHIVKRNSAKRGRITPDAKNNAISIDLFDAVTEINQVDEVEVRAPAPALPATNLFNTNSLQMLLTNTEPGRLIGISRVPRWFATQSGSISIGPIDLAKLAPTEGGPKITEMTFSQLRDELRKRRDEGITASPVLVQMHRQVAFSFASFAFTLVAIPLGIRAHRRETSIGMALALILVMVYYSFLILGQALQMREHLHPHLIIWIPNILFQTLGAILLYRANKKG
jgi:lipopolysaccharide export system permease protein